MAMRVVFVVLAVTALGTGPAPAHAVGPVGRTCSFHSAIDVTREPGWQVGVIYAGPLVTGEPGTLWCSIHVDNGVHSGAAVVREGAGATGGVAVMAPRPIGYPLTAASTVTSCTSWAGAVTWYWVGTGSAFGQGYWTTDPNAPCHQPAPLDANDPECRVWHSVDNRAGTNLAEVWQDCEGYPPLV